MRVTQAIQRNLQLHPDEPATICGERRRTWQAFADRIARLAGGLQTLGLEPEDRVAIIGLNSDHYLEVLYAVPWAGGIVVPINTRWSVPEIAYALTDAGVRFVVVDAAYRSLLEELSQAVPQQLTPVFLSDGAGETGLTSSELLIRDSAPAAERGRGGDDISGIFYTGGTTGRSKGVMLTHANHVTNSLQLAAMIGLPAPITYLHAAPMFHIADALFVYMVTALGGVHVVIPRFEPAACAKALQDHAITDVILVPTMIQMLLDHPDLARYDLGRLERLYYGASPMPEATLYRLFDALPVCKRIQLYGQTEAAPMLTVLEDRFHVKNGPAAGRLRSAGRAIPCVEIRIVDEHDAAVAPGVVGEVTARGPNIMKGYWGLEKQTAETLRGGWLHTGDAAYMDEAGFIYISDRLKDMIISGGENVYSTEVENAVYQHPSVAQCAVIGVPDEKWGERVHAIVVPKPGMPQDAQALIAHCRKLIADFKCPRSVEFRDQPLPLSGAGKVLKTELRKPYWEGRARKI